MQKYELNLWDYWRIIRKRRGIVLLAAIIIPVITLAITWIRRPVPVYETTSSVRVERSMSMTGLFVEMLSVPSGDLLATQALIIKSFPVLEKVAREMALIPQDIESDQIYANDKYSDVLSEMQGEIKTEIEGTTNIINIKVSSSDPQRAYKIANLVSEKYMKENTLLRNKQIFEAKKFIEDQLTIVEGKLKTSEDALNEYKRQKDVISITDEQKIAIDKFSGIEVNLESVNREIKGTEYNLALLKKGELIPGKQTIRFFSDSGENQSAITSLNQKLGELLLERNNLLINSTATHPEVKELDAKIANIRTEIITQLESKRNSLVKKADILTTELNRLKSNASFLPSTAMELSRIERDVKINQELYSLLKTKYQEALIKEAEKIEEVSIIKRATEPKFPMNPPKFFLNTLLGLVIGMILGLVFAFIFESLDTSIGTLEDVEEFLDIPVIGSIPNMNIDKADDFLRERYNITTDYRMDIYRALISHSMPKSIVAESYRSLRTNAIFVATEKNIKSMMITSSSTHEGKTTTAINLALTLAQIGKRVLLMDVDFRNPAIHHYFGLEKDPGLSDVILGNSTWKEVGRSIADIMMGEIKVDDIMSNPGMDNLNIITSGTPPAHPAEFLNSPILPKLISEIAEHYDFVILDAPPVMPVADPIIIGNKVDGVFIVYKVGIISRYALKRTKLLLENVGAKVFGTILNDFKPETSPDFSHGAYYEYARKEGFQKKDFDTFTERLNSLLKSIFKRKKNLVNNGTSLNKQKETDNINKPYDISGPDI
jgi:capsular exopolysaccharide synthesis family protein